MPVSAGLTEVTKKLKSLPWSDPSFTGELTGRKEEGKDFREK